MNKYAVLAFNVIIVAEIGRTVESIALNRIEIETSAALSFNSNVILISRAIA
jgi:hypothetical protein